MKECRLSQSELSMVKYRLGEFQTWSTRSELTLRGKENKKQTTKKKKKEKAKEKNTVLGSFSFNLV